MFLYLKKLTTLRKQEGYFVDQPVNILQATAKGFVFGRGAQHQTLVFLTNTGHGVVEEIELKDHELSNVKDGTDYMDIFSSDIFTVTRCHLKVVLTNGEPLILNKTQQGTGKACNSLSSTASCFKLGYDLHDFIWLAWLLVAILVSLF